MAGTAARYRRKASPQWTLREMRLVEHHYGRMTRRQLVRRHLPERTIKAVERMARLLGVCRRRRPVKLWSKADLALLRRLYGTMENTELCRLHFPGVSTRALCHRARRLGLRSKEPEWTAAEDRLVRTHYGHMSSRDLAARYLPRRTALAVQSRGEKLGRSRWASNAWSAKELQLLRKHYATRSVRDVARYLPGRTHNAIRTRTRLEGLQKEGPASAWTAREHALIRRHYEARDGRQRLLRALSGRSWLAIQQQARKLGVSRAGNPWTAQDDALLRRLFPKHGFKTRIPGHTPGSVRVHAQKLGLRRRPAPPPGSRQWQDWSKEEIRTMRDNRTLSSKALAALLRGRSARAITVKRSVLGIGRVAGSGRGSGWSEREQSILRRHARADARELLALLPGRTYDSIRTQLRRLARPRRKAAAQRTAR